MLIASALWLAAGVGACAAETPFGAHFTDEAEDSLIRQIEPGPGVSVSVADTPAEALAARWRLTATPEQLTAEDPATGLRFTQRRTWIPELRALFVESTLANAGNAPVTASRVGAAEWAFRVGEATAGPRYEPLTYRNDTWYGSTYWTGPDWTRVGRDWHHPGENTPSVRRFTAPRDGRLTISGRVYKAHLDGDGVRVFVRHNAATLWQAELEGKDAKGLEPSLTLEVHRGDAIRFVVHKRGQIYCDTTRWDPIITYADGERFVASEGFSTERQGHRGWFYEMEAAPQEQRGIPTLYGLRRSCSLIEEPLAGGRAVGFSSADALPLLVLADGRDQSGIFLAILGKAPWRLSALLAPDGRLSLEVGPQDGVELLSAGARPKELPTLLLGAYRGRGVAGMAALERLGSRDPKRGGTLNSRTPIGRAIADWKGRLDRAYFLALAPSLAGLTLDVDGMCPELDLWAMVLADWRRQDKLVETAGSYESAARRAAKEASRLFAAARGGMEANVLRSCQVELDVLARDMDRAAIPIETWRSLYVRARSAQRYLMLATVQPKLGETLFVKRVPTSYSHLVMQYFGWRARPGGGIFVLEKPGESLATRQLFDASTGNVLEPRLSYDAKRIIFSYSKCTKEDPFYHLCELDLAKGTVRQLTSGEYEDLMPNYLPDGGIVFSSTRRKGHARCFGGQFGPRWHVYTLHRMNGDGSDIRTLSFHETNEWFPTVAPSGHILYSRWDYVDRHPVVHQNLWACRPDGTNPVALWGNHTETPHCTFQLQPIPGTSKVVFTASAHHSITGGSIAIVDPRLGNNGQQAITRLTPEVRFPEAEGGISEYYDSPWPLSEHHFLVGYSPKPLLMEPQPNDPAALGIYLLDRFGNRELLYRDPLIGASNPIPLVPRPTPPIIPASADPKEGFGQDSQDEQDGRPKATSAPSPARPVHPVHPVHDPSRPPTGEMILLDVYQGLGDVPRGTIKALRIIQILPKTTPVADAPRVGLAGQEPTRAVLGTVPVEPDGSAYFTVPARKPILFQALDADGFAYQTMRSITYLQPGEKTSCIGCHERRSTAPPNTNALAWRRAPSPIEPGPDSSRPFSYVRLVQPILDKHCVRCHSGPEPKNGLDLTATPHDGFTRSYWSLCGGLTFWQGKTNPATAREALVPRYGGWNPVHLTPPGGMYGARGSRLIQTLLKRQSASRLPPADLQRIALWIDCNAIFYGVYDPGEQARQLRGEAVEMPEIQ